MRLNLSRWRAQKRQADMNEHARPLTLSERADELEEQMMHDLSERIATRSTLFYLGDGKVQMDFGDKLLAANPGSIFSWAPTRGCRNAGPADADRFLQGAVCHHQPFAAERDARAQGRAPREGGACLPTARHRRRELHPLRPRLLGRADDRALCRRGSGMGGAHASGVALLPRSVGRLRISGNVSSSCSATTTNPSRISSPNTSARGTTSGT